MGGMSALGAALGAGLGGLGATATGSILSTIIPLVSAATGIAGSVMKGMNSHDEGTVPTIPLTRDQTGVSHGLAQTFGSGFGNPQLGGFGGMSGMGGGPLLNRVNTLQQKLGMITQGAPQMPQLKLG